MCWWVVYYLLLWRNGYCFVVRLYCSDAIRARWFLVILCCYQTSLLHYFWQTREESFFAAIRTRIHLAALAIKEKWVVTCLCIQCSAALVVLCQLRTTAECFVNQHRLGIVDLHLQWFSMFLRLWTSRWGVTVRTANNCDFRHVAVLADCLLTVVVPRPTRPSIPPGSVNEDQLRLGRLRQVWFIPFVDKRQGGR